MKHLLITLSLLLLSSPVIGEETGVLYQYETSSGFVWETFGDDKIQPKYKGKIKNGKMDGLGFMTYPYGEKSVVGEWKEGKEWNTKHTKKDGTLIGKYKNGEWIVSWGVLYLGKRKGEIGYYQKKWEGVESKDNKDLSKNEGEIKNGLPNGQGTETFSDGSMYVGEFKDGKYSGQGTFTHPDGENYEGKWKDGKKNGQGTFYYTNGGVYVGEFKDGERNGQGTYTFPSGGKKWVNGKEKKLIPNDFVKKNIKWMEIIQNLNNNLILDSNNLKIHQTKINFTKSFNIFLYKVIRY